MPRRQGQGEAGNARAATQQPTTPSNRQQAAQTAQAPHRATTLPEPPAQVTAAPATPAPAS